MNIPQQHIETILGPLAAKHAVAQLGTSVFLGLSWGALIAPVMTRQQLAITPHELMISIGAMGAALVLNAIRLRAKHILSQVINS